MDKMSMVNYMLKKAKAKKMAQGGKVSEASLIGGMKELKPFNEEENHNPDDFESKHHGHAHDSEPENYQSNNHGRGFHENEIATNEDKYDVRPKNFAKGGMCYAEGGSVEVHPLDMMYRKKFLEAKKLAYGGKVENNNIPLDDYDEYEEDNKQMEITNEGTQKPALYEADDKPNEDEDRLAFARQYRTKRAMR